MPSASEHPNINPWIVAVAVMFATFMEVLDTTVVNVSLPHIAGSLSVSTDEAAWALTSYLVANAIILPMTGWIANYFGRKRTLLAAVFGFTAASFLCGLATSLPMLIFFRVVQGATGGALQPLSQAVMLEAFPPQDRGKAMAFWGLGIVVAPMLGPVIGGYLTDNFSWRWVFYINLPVGLASVIMTRLFIFDPPYIGRQKRGVDYWGIGMLALGVGALQVVLDKGQEDDWFAANWIVVATVIAAASLILFVVHELHTREPVVHLRVFKDRTYAAGVFLMTMLGFVLYGSLLLLPIFLQTMLGYPALNAGIAMAPRGLGSFLMMPLVGTVLGRFDPRKVLAVGTGGRVVDAVPAFQSESECGLLGHFLAAVRAGCVAGAAVRAADDGHDGPHPEGRDGQRHQHVQFDAQPGGRLRNRRGHYVPVPAAAVPHATAGGTREHAELADPGVLPEFGEHDDEARRGSGGGGDAILCRAVGHGAASGGDARFCGYVPGDGDCVSAGAAVPVHHETAEAPSGRGSDALRGASPNAPSEVTDLPH